VVYNAQTAETLPDLRVLGDSDPNAITVSRSGLTYVIESNTVITDQNLTCQGNGTVRVTCPDAPTISADLGAGNDSFNTSGVTVPVLVAGGPGNDVLTGGAGADVLAGGDNNDVLEGRAGTDAFFGEGGDDTILAVDHNAERISCGTGNDLARNDPIDIIAECEGGIDGDKDGFASFTDCDDENPAIHPGAVDILDNAVDENCDGALARNLDRDGDGFPIPTDCNDANAAIHPGALEIRGNQVDENCDSRAQGFALLRSLVSTNWQFGRTFTRVRALIVRNAPAGARIAVRCKGRGCPFKGTRRATVRRALAPLSLRRLFRQAKLRAGTRVTVAVTAPQFVGRTYTYRLRNGQLPATSIICRAPGEKEGRSC